MKNYIKKHARNTLKKWIAWLLTQYEEIKADLVEEQKKMQDEYCKFIEKEGEQKKALEEKNKTNFEMRQEGDAELVEINKLLEERATLLKEGNKLLEEKGNLQRQINEIQHCTISLRESMIITLKADEEELRQKKEA